MDWSDLAFFLSVHRHRSLRRAGRAHGVAPTTVGRRLASLEEALGERLFDRTPDGLVPTMAGDALAELALDVEERVHVLERTMLARRSESIDGELRVSATETICSEIVAPALPALLGAHPSLRLVLVSDSAVVSLARRDADLAIRMFRPEGQSLVHRRLAVIRLGLFARRDLLGRADELPVLGYDDSNGAIPEVQWMEQTGLAARLVLRTNSTRTLLRAAHAGLGVALLPSFWGDEDDDLAAVPLPAPIPDRTVWLTYHEDLRSMPAVRVVVEHLVAAFDARLGA